MPDSAPHIVVIGSANIDLVTRVPRAPKPGETMVGHDFRTVCGGKGANQAIAAARLGAQVTFVGCVGGDAFGQMQRDSLEQAGVDTTYLRTSDSEPTGTAVILVTDTGENSIIITPGANFATQPGDIAALESLIARADTVLVQLEIPPETVEAALHLARTHGVRTILDPGVAKALPESLIRKADIISPNETEAEAITGVHVDSIDAALHAAQRLTDMGAKTAVLKLGRQGAFYAGPDGELYAPAFDVQPVDTTAAGDAFTAALAVVWETMPAAEALRFANAAGGAAITIHGAQPSMPGRNAIEAVTAMQKRSNGP